MSVELRWVVRERPNECRVVNGNRIPATVRVLQYRTLGEPYLAGDTARRDWSDWQDVPVVEDGGG